MDTVFQVICVQFLFFLLYGYADVNGCRALSPKFGTISPDHNVEVGSPVQINCTLFHHNIVINGTEYYANSSNLLFRFSDENLSDVHIIDPFTAQLRLENSTVNNTGVYHCLLKTSGRSILICTTKIRVGYKPLPVERFNCISWHYRNLTCEWKLPFNPVETTYTLNDYMYYIEAANTFFGNRSCPVPMPTSCQWRVDTDPMYRKASDKLYFLLTGNNSLGKNSQFFKVDHFKIVLPGKPRGIFLNYISQNSIHVQWEKPKEMEFEEFKPGLTYELHYQPYPGSPENWEVITVKSGLRYNITGLVPFTEYKIQIRCRSSVAEGEDMWSPFITTEGKTKPDVPYDLPVVINEAVEVENCQVNRSIKIHWTPVPKTKWNGKNFVYVVTYVSTHSPRHKREINSLKVDGEALFIVIRNLDQHTAYKFNIYSENQEGKSKSFSSLTVPKSSQMLSISPEDITVVHYSQGRYIISWKPPKNDANILNYTVFWCKRNSLNLCSEPLDWKIIPVEEKKKEYEEMISPDLHNKDGNYQFAISANTKDFSSGMKWASCIALNNKVLDMIQNFKVIDGNSTSLTAMWILACNGAKKIIKYYQISYCRVNGSCKSQCNCQCIEKESHVQVNNSQLTTYVLTDLSPFTKYKATIHAVTNGGASASSYPWCAKTKSDAPYDPPQNAQVVNVANKSITVSWEPPLQPNGIITNYNIHYNQYVKVETAKTGDLKYVVTLTDNVFYFTNYSIQIEACVDTDGAKKCSPSTTDIYAFIGIGAPELMEKPSVEVRNATYVRISWKPPIMPNGPIDLYFITAQSSAELSIFNISGSENYTFASLPCPVKENDVTYNFMIRAANFDGNDTLLGPISEPSSTTLCYMLDGIQLSLMIGVIAGGTLGLMALVFVVYLLVRWMKKEVDMIKNITVLLPTGLESESYASFKQGLDQKGSNSSVSPQPYGRLNSSTSDEGDSKDRHDSGNSQYSNLSSEELLQKRSSEFGRNPSGDSNTFSRGHDSISSSATNHTQLSSDSGTEIDLQAPPSPDTVFPESVSISTTPKTFARSGLSVVEEGHDSDSKDSGLEKEGTTGASPSSTDLGIGRYTRFAGYLNNNSRPYTNMDAIHVHQPSPYSKFSIASPDGSSCIPSVGQSGQQSALSHFLANSEPSVVDVDDGSENESNSSQGVSQYSRYGIARSVEAGLDRSSLSSTGYSKFGVIHHPINTPGRSGKEPPSSPCSTGFGIQGPHLQDKKPYVTTNFAAILLDKNKSPIQKSEQPLSGLALNSNKNPIHPISNSSVKDKVALQQPKDSVVLHSEKQDVHNEAHSDLVDSLSNGYSKFGIQPESCKPSVKNYIGFQQAKDLSDNTIVPACKTKQHNNEILPAMGYSKVDLHPCTTNQKDINYLGEDKNDMCTPPSLLSRTPAIKSTGAKPKNPVQKAHNGYVPHSHMDRLASALDTKRNKSFVPVEDTSNDFFPVSNKELNSTNPTPIEMNGNNTSELPLLNTVPVSYDETDRKCVPNREETKLQLSIPPTLEPPTSTTGDPKPKVSLLSNGSKNHYPSKVKAKSNGYVPMSDILGSDITQENCKVEILPKALQNGFSLSESDI